MIIRFAPILQHAVVEIYVRGHLQVKENEHIQRATKLCRARVGVWSHGRFSLLILMFKEPSVSCTSLQSQSLSKTSLRWASAINCNTHLKCKCLLMSCKIYMHNNRSRVAPV